MNQINHFGIFTKLNSVNNESNKPFQNIYQTKQGKQ